METTVEVTAAVTVESTAEATETATPDQTWEQAFFQDNQPTSRQGTQPFAQIEAVVQSQTLEFIENFGDVAAVPPGQAEAIEIVSGAPPPPVVAQGPALSTSTSAHVYANSQPQIVRIQVDLQLGTDPTRTYRVIAVDWLAGSAKLNLPNYVDEVVRVEFKDGADNVLFSRVCFNNPGSPPPPCNTDPPPPGIQGVRTVTFIHETASPLSVPSGSGYVVALDNLGVTTDQVTIPCPATVRITDGSNNAIIRSAPGGAQIASVPNGGTVEIVGRNADWYFVEYDPNNPSLRGWIWGELVPQLGCDTRIVPLLDAAGNPLTTPPFDYPMEAPPTAWNPDNRATETNFPCDNTGATRENCSRIVYFVWYHKFHDTNNRYPMLSDFLAVIYTNEFARAVGNREDARAALTNSYWGSIHKTPSSCLNDDTACRLPLDSPAPNGNSIIIYLSGVQSWYEKGGNGHPHPLNTFGNNGYDMLLDPTNAVYLSVGYEILQSKNHGCATGVACAWGNYGFGSYDNRPGGTGQLNYALVKDSLNPPILFCRTFRGFKDGDGNPDTAIHPPQGSDEWYEYRFAIATGSVGTTSTYKYELTPGVPNNPDWLRDDAFILNAQGQPELDNQGRPKRQRDNLGRLPSNCP